MASQVQFSEKKLLWMGKYIQPRNMFGKLTSLLKVCLTSGDLISAAITPFVVGSRGRGIES